MNPADEIESYQADVLFDMNMALLDACRAGDLTTVKRLSKTGFIDLNRKMFLDGYTALWWACRYDHQEIVKFLIEEKKVNICRIELADLVKCSHFCTLHIRDAYSLMTTKTRAIIRTLLIITESIHNTPEVKLLKDTSGDVFLLILNAIVKNEFRELQEK